MKKNFLHLMCMFLLVKPDFAQFKINPSFYGQNFWLTNYRGAPFGSIPSNLSSEWTAIGQSGVKMIRVGGHNYNYETNLSNYSAPHDPNTPSNGEIIPAGYVKIVDDIRSQGLEPMITVPFRDDHFRTIAAQADTAAEIVRVVNMVHKRNVKYWIISNEPEKDQTFWTSYTDQEKADHIRAYIQKFAVEMKKVDQSIQIIGPELNSDNEGLLDLLFADPGSNTASIKGTIGSTFQGEDLSSYSGLSSKYFIDLLSFHVYDGYESTWSNAATTRQGYTDAAYYFGTYGTSTGRFKRDYERWVAGDGTIGTDDRTSTMKMVVDEFNMEDFVQQGSVLTTTAVTDEVKDANTFLSGQLIIDLMAGMLGTKNNTSNNDNVFELSNLWSVKESGSYGGAFGYLNYSDDAKKATYWHYYMMANYFKGAFYNNKVADPGTNDPMRCLRAYGCKNKDYIAVIIVNQMQNDDNTPNTTARTYNSLGSSHTFTINFNNNTSGRTFAFDMNQSTWGTADYSSSIDNKSTSLLIFECNQSNYSTPTLKVRWDFKESEFKNDLGSYTISGHLVTGTQSTLPSTSALDIAASTGNCINTTTSLTAPSGASTYSWVPGGQTTQTATGLTAGMYQVKMTGGCGETWLTGIVDGTSPTLQLVNINTPNIQITSGQFALYGCSNSNVQLSWNASSGSTFSWAPSAGLSSSTINNPTASPTVSTTYTVYVSDGNGCSISDQIRVIRQDNNTSNEDLFLKDDASDAGSEPNSTECCGVFWTSPDIWITATPTGSPTYEAEYTSGTDPSYIHVLIHNSGSNTAEGLLNVYWSKAGVAQNWGTSTGWINYDDGTASELIYADQIGIPIHVSVGGSGTYEAIIPWFPPNPADYSTFGDPQHFCLLARLETGCGMTNEGTNTYINCVWSKKTVQRNITVVDNIPGIVFPPKGQIYDVMAQNTDNASRTLKFEFVGRSNAHSETFFDYGHAYFYMDPNLYSSWVTGGSQGYGVTDIGNNIIEVSSNNAYVQGISATASETFFNAMRFSFLRQDTDTLNFDVDVIEKKIVLGAPPATWGGERYVIVPVDCPTANALNHEIDIDLGCGADLEVDDPQSGVEYIWYDESGTEVGEGTPVTVYPDESTYYVLRAAQHGCIINDTVYVNVDQETNCEGRLAIGNKSNAQGFLSIAPNPGTDKTTISCYLPENSYGELKISNMYGQLISSYPIVGQQKLNLDLVPYSSGIYYCFLYSKDKLMLTRKLIVNH